MEKIFRMRSEVLLYPGMAGWHFIVVSKKQSEEIKKKFGSKQRGWGSLPVMATIGKTSWKSSIFPDTKTSTYLLPLKAEVRKKEGIRAKESVIFSIKLLV